MKKVSSVIWGILLIAVGVIWALNGMGITHINIFFDGWWSLFLIIPCGIGLFTEREKDGNVIGLATGVLLLLCSQEILDFSVMWKLLLPAIIVWIGLKLVWTGLFGNKAKELIKKSKAEGKATQKGWAIFSGCDINCDGETFTGGEVTTVFGGLTYDLRRAVIEKDCAIRVVAVFGGGDILVPDHVNVKVQSNCAFGDVSNKTAVHKDGPTVYVSAVCIFGGLEIK